MGEIYAKPVQDELLTQLQLRYETLYQSKQIPGQPTHLKIISQPPITSSITQLTMKYPKIDQYSLTLTLNQQNWRNQKNIYQYRKINYPCLVQVIHFQLQKQDCECITHGYKLAVFTEHVQTRLANFKLVKNDNKNSYRQVQYYDSFTLDQGIYVLINTLHAYQLLCEQYWVSYPTPFTIGITGRAKVKVWINENWALNTASNRKITQNLIIEEIINLIEERMDGSFSKILNYKYNYINFNFDFIQDLLSTYTINFHKGKQTLEEKINSKNITETDPIIYTDLPEGTAKIKFQADHVYGKSEADEKQVQKRHFSQSCLKSQQIFLPPSYSCRKSIEPPPSSASQSMKKNINFIYRTHEPSAKTLSKFSASSKITCPMTSQNSIYLRNPSTQNSNLINPLINLTVSNQTKIAPFQIPVSYSNTLKRMDKRHWQTINVQQQQKRLSISLDNSNRQTYKHESPIKTFLDYAISHSSYQYSPSNESPKELTRKVSYQFTEEAITLGSTTQKAGQTLSSITEQFKNLLQMGKKTDHEQNIKEVQQYHAYPMEQVDERQQKKNQTIAFGQQFEQIKQQDQDVNYSFDQNV